MLINVTLGSRQGSMVHDCLILLEKLTDDMQCFNHLGVHTLLLNNSDLKLYTYIRTLTQQ